MNKKIVLSSFLVVLFCILTFGSSALAHGKVASSGHTVAHPRHDSPRICYTVLKSDMLWVEPEACNNELIPSDAKGIYGFGASLEGVPSNRHIQYNVYAGGKWLGWAKDGDRVDTGGAIITAILVQLTPQKGSSLDIFAVDKMGMVYQGNDNVVVGDVSATAVGLTKLRMQLHYKP